MAILTDGIGPTDQERLEKGTVDGSEVGSSLVHVRSWWIASSVQQSLFAHWTARTTISTGTSIYIGFHGQSSPRNKNWILVSINIGRLS